jgi:hypothetical protein
MQRSEELLDLRTPDRVLPALGLDLDEIEPKLVLTDHAVHTLIAALAEAARRILVGAPIAHPSEHVQDQLLEEGRRLLHYALQDLRRKRASQQPVRHIDLLFRRMFGPARLALDVGLSQAEFHGDSETRISVLGRGTPFHATTEEVSG